MGGLAQMEGKQQQSWATAGSTPELLLQRGRAREGLRAEHHPQVPTIQGSPLPSSLTVRSPLMSSPSVMGPEGPAIYQVAMSLFTPVSRINPQTNLQEKVNEASSLEFPPQKPRPA